MVKETKEIIICDMCKTEIENEFNTYSCYRCDIDLCENCQYSCFECDDYFCANCLEFEANEAYCDNCLSMVVRECIQCNTMFNTHQEGVFTDEFQDDQDEWFCEYCYKQLSECTDEELKHMKNY